MPFQSEKQRRYLHANHPEIAKRWEKEYSHGGILDINESEEIISDDGNDIELTDYNAAFDDPNDLSTGVKTLFKAKDGGRIGLYQGGGPHAGGYGTTSSSSNTGGGGHPHGGVASQYSGSTSIGSGRTRIQEDRAEDERKKAADLAFSRSPAADEEKYDSWEQMIQNKYTGQGVDAEELHFSIQKNKAILNKARQDWYAVRDKYNDKYKRKAGKMIIDGLLGKGVTFGIGSIIEMMVDGYKTNKAKQEFISDIQKTIANFTKLGLPTHSPHTDTDIQILNQEILDLTQKTKDDDDTKGDDPEVPQIVPIHQEIQEYEDIAARAMSPFDMKARQTLNAQLQNQWEQERLAKAAEYEAAGLLADNPIVLNKGGLANLFRVKNQ